MADVTETYPFVGAKTVYRRSGVLLEWMARHGHVEQVKRSRKTVQCIPSDEMNTIIKALDTGDEHTLKATLLDPRFFDHCR